MVLAWRVHATALAYWTAGIVVMGLVLGAVAPNIGSMLDSPGARSMMERLGGVGALQDTLLAAELSIMAVVVTCFALSVIGHGGVDEHDGRTEQVLATAVSRSRSFLATASVAVVGATWLLVVFGVAAALGFRSAAGGDAFGRIVGAALAQVPAVWAVLALAMLAFAVRSTWAVLGWAFVTAFVVVGQLGELLRLPRWVIDLSPYVHVPRMPAEPYAAAPTLWLTAIALALMALAFVGYRSRDVG
jgi:ABC-2 type transport system permease protein